MEAALVGLLGLVVGAALSPLVTALAAWPGGPPGEGETPEESSPQPLTHRGEAGFARPLALVLERPLQATLLALATGGVFAAAALRYDDAGQLAVVTVYACAFLVCGATDLLSFRVPNVVTYPAIAGALLIAAFMPGSELGPSLAGGALAGGMLLFLAVVSRGGVGLGDVKLATFAGLALGWPLAFTALLITALGGGLISGLALLLRLRRRSDPLPYAPFIAAAAVAVMLWQGTNFREP